MNKRINCLLCKHYFSTWDTLSPRGCKVFGFKTHEIPAYVVRRESGKDCTSFELKKENPKKDELDLNDPKNW